MSKKVATTTFTQGPAQEDAPRSEEAVTHYEGPHGPVFAGYSEDRLATRVWGPHVPDGQLDHGPNGRLDGRQGGFYLDPVALRVGDLTGEALKPGWALVNRRRRAVEIRLGPRFYRYRVAGFSRPLLEEEDGTPVAGLGGVFGANRIAAAADPTDVALAQLLFSGVSMSEIRAQA